MKLTSYQVYVCVEVYLHFPIFLRGVMFSYAQNVFMAWCLVKYRNFTFLPLTVNIWYNGSLFKSTDFERNIKWGFTHTLPVL